MVAWLNAISGKDTKGRGKITLIKNNMKIIFTPKEQNNCFPLLPWSFSSTLSFLGLFLRLALSISSGPDIFSWTSSKYQ